MIKRFHLLAIHILPLLCPIVCPSGQASALEQQSYLCSADVEGAFRLIDQAEVAPIWFSADDHPGLEKVVAMLREDLRDVGGNAPEVINDQQPQVRSLVLVGTIGKSPLVDQLIRQEKLDVSEIQDTWEASVTQVVEKPIEGVDQALVIAGSDKRGTMYAVLDLSAQLGISPWKWWADVPVPRQEEVWIAPGPHVRKSPAVKYRGIFINDEAPALANWAHEKFGGCNSQFYEHVYQLMLRMKANYLWPAMWGRSLFDDDPKSAPLADQYGIVIGTTHHEPMMRAHVEWHRYGEGPWNYETNADTLRQFWREGIERMNGYESIVTLGMRGDGDEPMTDEANIELLQRIVADQREILRELLDKPVEEQPQIWALYKEVQEYYDRGMRVPDDVTLLLCDDNWGNLRKLPHPDSPPHPGGYGIYYHFDYVGDPRNYKWINTNPLPRIWEQMNLAYEHGVTEIWIVNVGDIKPMELPTEFFLDMAWNPRQWNAERVNEYPRRWAAREFGPEHAEAIGEVLAKYAKYNGRRKPELLDADTYSLVNFREFERVVEEYRALAEMAQSIGDQLPPRYQDAYFQLVLYPTVASANLHELYYAVARNRLYSEQGRAATNALAQEARELFERDEQLAEQYHQLNDGKWNHMMSQTHIGYTYWQQPEEQVMPEVHEIDVPQAAEMGVAVEGTKQWWPASDETTVLPEMVEPGPDRYIEVFNRAKEPFQFTASTEEPWLEVTPREGEVEDQTRLHVAVDRSQVPAGVDRGSITLESSTGVSVAVEVPINPLSRRQQYPGAWMENNGYVSIPAEQFSQSVSEGELKWITVPDLGRTGSAVMPTPVTASRQDVGDGPHLEYEVLLESSGEVEIVVLASPTQEFYGRDGLHYAISFDDQEPQSVSLHSDRRHRAWQQSVANNINRSTSSHKIAEPGLHVLKLWMVDPGVVVQKLIVETGEVPSSYLGPPPSPRDQ